MGDHNAPMPASGQPSLKSHGARQGAAPAQTYWVAARRPLHCLVFLFPLLAAYELGALVLHSAGWAGQPLVAAGLIQQLVGWLGTDAAWVPGAALLATLVVWQFGGRHSWDVRGAALPLMALESLVLTLPLFVVRGLLEPAGGAVPGPVLARMTTLLGAAIYEELVFRLYLVGGLLYLLANVCRLRKRVAVATAVGLGALVFAACHLRPIGADAFAWPRFLMLAVAGAYLALVLIARGLGVATGCHAAYNLIAFGLGLV
jgi:hypothetical protein